MSNAAPDESEQQLLQPRLDDLFQKKFSKLGGVSCRTLLYEVLQSRWEKLTLASCQRGNRQIPAEDDAILAFDALKYALLGGIKVEEITELTLPEIWQLLKRLRLRYWIWFLTLIQAPLLAAA